MNKSYEFQNDQLVQVPARPQVLEEPKRCPRPDCRTVALDSQEIEDFFGYRWMGGKQKIQSWCKICRRVSASAKPAPEAKETSAPAAAVAPDVITTDRTQIQALYKKHFPGDTNGHQREMKFMVLKLIKKLPNAIVHDKVKEMFSLD